MFVVASIWVVAATIGLMGLVNPKPIIGLVEHWGGAARFRLAVGVRLVLGVILLVVAPLCRLPVWSRPSV